MAYTGTKAFSERKLGELRAALKDVVPPGSVALTCGSYARREASAESDIDFFILTDDEAAATEDGPDWARAAEAEIAKLVPNSPAAGGAFAQTLGLNSMIDNVGGQADTNENITRRMLVLLEGDWLQNEALFESKRDEVIDKYVGSSNGDHHIVKFLLNDIIRYWRTITVDYEYKTGGPGGVKPWAIRNVKLAFSRKLLYAGGLFSVGETADRTQAEKAAILKELFSIPPLERIERICGSKLFAPIGHSYDIFLDEMEDSTVRSHLKSLDKKDRDSDVVFRRLKNEAQHFNRHLLKAFEDRFHSSHPIRQAVIF